MNKIYLLSILLASMIMVEPVESGDVSIMPDVTTSNATPTPNNPPQLSITADTQTIYVGELKTVVFTVNAKSSCNPSLGGTCATSETSVPLSDANVQLQGAATGGGVTKDQGQLVMTINAANTGTITAIASKSGYIDGSVTINVENRPKPPPLLNITTDTPTVNVGESKSVTFTVTTENTCNPSSGQACPMATTADQSDIPVSETNVHLEGCASGNGKIDSNGNTIITVNANCAGTITAIASKSGYTDGKTTIEAKRLAIPTPSTPTPTPTPIPTPSTPTPSTPTPTHTPSTPTPSTPTPTHTPSTPTPSLKHFRVGPTVNLRPVKDDISKSEDGLIELYMDNPSLNDVMMYADVRISVPSGISVYGQGFGDAGSAGVLHGTFDISPGKSRTIQMTVKAEKTGEFIIKFSGLYWPENDKDDYQPISLTHTFKVRDLTVPTIVTTPEKDRFDIIKWLLDILNKILGPT